MRFALLLDTPSFEEFWGSQPAAKEQYVESWRGGWVWSYCRMLQAEGIVPHIYIGTLAAGAVHETREGYRIRFLKLGPAYRAWRRVPWASRSPYGRFMRGLVNGASLMPALRNALREDEIDVVGLQEYWTSRFDYLSGRVDIPVLAVDQGAVGDREVKVLKRRSLPRAGRIATQTKHEADRLRRYGARPERIPNAIDSDFWCPGIPTLSAERSVICVGRLNDDHKRISDLIRALVLLGPAWRLGLVGRGRDADALADLANAIGVQDQVHFHGFTRERAEIRRLVRAAGVFCLASRREGLPMALLEAMSTATPVVCSDIPAMAEVVTDGVDGHVFPLGNVERLAKAIASAYDHREQMGPAARATIEENYTEAVIGRQLAEVIRGLAGEGSRSRTLVGA